jgi:asparagine synthase (glutamine-hydrolysing)
MSAIVGLYHLSNQTIESSQLSAMLDTLAHRGPDRRDSWCDHHIGLGHGMLWTTPESLHETLPLATASGQRVITADARIDNRDELMHRLQLDGPSHQITDSQLILNAYEHWGERCIEYLVGDFAFAIWDAQQQSLFCARDHFGVRPFYYYQSQDLFAFASEVKGLLCHPDIPHQLNETRVADFLSVEFDDTSATFYQDIWRLPPAHLLQVSAEGLQLKRYWSLELQNELQLDSDQDYAVQFRELFTEAVRCRLRSAFPIGSMLSGGLDSSSITCVAKQLLEASEQLPLATFSAIFNEVTECDEQPYINAVLSQGGFDPHVIQGDQLSPLTDCDRVLWHQDEPLYAFNLFLTWNLYKIAKTRNVRVILDGFDGDSTVSHGIGYLTDLAREGQWLKLVQNVRGLTQNFEYSFWEWLWPYINNYGLKPLLDKSKLSYLSNRIQRRIQRVRRPASSLGDRTASPTILNKAFGQRIQFQERIKAFRRHRVKSGKKHRTEHQYNLVRGVMPYTLEVMDKAGAAFGIELRFPFWDKRLVEFCLSLPPEQKIRRGWTRLILRQAMDGILPEAIQWRGGKSNLGPNFKVGLLKFEQERLVAALTQHAALVEPYVDIHTWNSAHQKYLAGNAHIDDAMMVWRVVNLVLWLQSTNMQSSKPDDVRQAPETLVGGMPMSG